jgi:hypothetical protein
VSDFDSKLYQNLANKFGTRLNTLVLQQILYNHCPSQKKRFLATYNISILASVVLKHVNNLFSRIKSFLTPVFQKQEHNPIKEVYS